MPTYEYRCTECGRVGWTLRKFEEKHDPIACGEDYIDPKLKDGVVTCGAPMEAVYNSRMCFPHPGMPWNIYGDEPPENIDEWNRHEC